ncbi:MAG: two-component system sensor histidine kinase NtrB [Phycisphaerales bacterium]
MAALDPIITIDTAGTILSASDSIFPVLGWTPDDLIGRHVSVLMPEPPHLAHDGYPDPSEAGKTGIVDNPRHLEALHKDGTVVPVEMCVSRTTKPADGPLFIAILRDMRAQVAERQAHSDQQALFQQQLAEQTSALQEAHLRLRMADRMASIGTLASGLGHDMNNVLLPVRAQLSAASAAARDPDAQRHLQEIGIAIEYLQQLADGLHFLSLDPDTEASDLGGAEVIDLHEWWGNVGMLLSKAVPGHIRVEASVPEGLPRVRVSAHAMSQAVLNLVINAGHACGELAESDRRGTVRVWAEPCEDFGRRSVRFCVSDNGTGMSKEVRRRAFEMFFTTKPRGRGTGLGLTLVRKAIEGAGGTVVIESELGHGTTVTLRIPGAPAGEHPYASDKQPTASILISDGRAEALVRELQSAAGIADAGDNPADMDLCIAEPRPEHLEQVRAWRSSKPWHPLVLLRPPSAADAPEWIGLDAIVIDTPDDPAAIKSAIHRALRILRSLP